MSPNDLHKAWETYKERELPGVHPALLKLGITLDDEQVHLSGERFLMAGARDVGGGGYKLVLVGRKEESGRRVIIKVSSDPEGIKEIVREREARRILGKLDFASETFATPEEFYFGKRAGLTICVTAYIEQERGFLARPIDEQFFLALRAFEAQEGVHATTYEHARTIRDAFGVADVRFYLTAFKAYCADACAHDPSNEALAEAFRLARDFLSDNSSVIEHYSGFLTHADFVPHNMRISGNRLYLLDYASMHFGNKYESWGRFLNFMVHHNPALEGMLARYVRENRGKDEHLSLRLMRVYKLGFLLKFYTGSLALTSGDLHALVRARIIFWTNVLGALLADIAVPEEVIEQYLRERNRLRSAEENARQREILGRPTS
jgi:hypothetical protein